MNDRASNPARRMTRGLLLGWSLWLLASWLLGMRVFGPSLTPVMRCTLISAMSGVLLAWPAWRLGQAKPASPTRATLVDFLLLLAVFQVVVMRMAVEWPLDRAIVADAGFAAYALVGAVWVDLGRRGGPGRRVLAMALCIGTLLCGLGLGAFGLERWALIASPPKLMMHATAEGALVDAAALAPSLAVLPAAVLIWAVGRGVDRAARAGAAG